MAKAKDTRPTAPAKAPIQVNTRTEKADENDQAKNRTSTDIKEPLTAEVTPARPDEDKSPMVVEDNRATKVVTQTKVIDNTDAPARPARKEPKAKRVKHPGRATEVLYV